MALFSDFKLTNAPRNLTLSKKLYIIDIDYLSAQLNNFLYKKYYLL